MAGQVACMPLARPLKNVLKPVEVAVFYSQTVEIFPILADFFSNRSLAGIST